MRTLLREHDQGNSVAQQPPTGNGAVSIPVRRILIAEDNPQLRQQLQELLSKEDGIAVESTGDGTEALELLSSGEWKYSICLTDLKLPGLDGIQLVEEVQQRGLPVTVIVFTGYGSIQDAVLAMRAGAYDFLTKPIDPDHLRLVVQRALRERSLQDEVLYLREQMHNRYAFRDVISKNPRMHAIFELIGNVAQTTTTVLVEGETGTGKELIARAIHQASARLRPGPFVPINCAALPESLLESELFGHEKGSFTGAIGQRQGRFELANGGTLFLDEIGEISPATQAKLLRVLQERRFERVGGTKSIEVDVRLVAATNRSLKGMVKKGKFREDLYFRVNVIRLDVPPLRERAEDIPLLATHFAAKYARPGEAPKTITPAAMDVLVHHRWPGNVRELENVIERACVISERETIEPHHLPPDLVAPGPPRLPLRIDLDRSLHDQLQELTALFEQQYIRKALRRTRGNVGRCATICGLSRRSLSTKLADYNIDKREFKEA
ncbi:MAG TPA: sigma-54 dependent transcriptional regulator [Gemmataceae bacterium]|nr:sigma-54 dependent transcriptional regulator [Gemmataceae bacterium]